MPVSICMTGGKPEYGALPAEKIIHYPLEARDYRPYVQAQFALGPEALYVRALAFEAEPDPESRIVLLLRAGKMWLVEAAAAPARDEELVRKGSRFPYQGVTWEGAARDGVPFPADCRAVSGEDLQGIYWGAEWSLNRPALEACLGKPLEAGSCLSGNILKVCRSADGKRDHFGCLFPCQPVFCIQEALSLAESDVGEFRIMGY